MGFGSYLVHRGKITPEQLLESLQQQEKMAPLLSELAEREGRHRHFVLRPLIVRPSVSNLFPLHRREVIGRAVGRA